MNEKNSAVEFLTLCSSGKVSDAFAVYVAKDFIHHNPYFAGDAKSLQAGMEENAAKNPNKICEIYRVIQENNLVVVHSKVRMNPDHLGIAVVHIFKFEAGKIIELWDVGQPIPEHSVNRNAMV